MRGFRFTLILILSLVVIDVAYGPAASAQTCIDYHACGPTVVGEPDPQFPSEDITLVGDLAYVAGGTSGFAIYSLVDPENPVQLSSLLLGCSVTKIVVEGDYAYLAAGSCGIKIYDISDPGVPAFVSGVSIGGRAEDIAKFGDCLYTLRENFDEYLLGCCDVADIEAPFFHSVLDTLWEYGYTDGARFEMLDDVLFAAAGKLRSYALDDPFAPVLLNEADIYGWGCRATARSGSTGYFLSARGVTIFDLGTPTDLNAERAVFLIEEARSLAVQAGSLFVGKDDATVPVYDLAAPYSPQQTDTIYLPKGARALDPGFDLLYVSHRLPGFSVVSTTGDDPCFPLSATTLGTVGFASTIVGDLLHIAGVTGVRTLDISDPTAPVELNLLPISEPLLDIDADNSSLFAAAGRIGLLIAAGAGTSMPAWISSHFISNATQVQTDRDVCWVMDSEHATLHAIDVADPFSPQPISSLSLPPGAIRFCLYGDHAFVACRAAGTVIVDISDPAAPHTISAFYPVLVAQDVAVVGSLAFVADIESGAVIFDIQDPSAPVQAGRVRLAEDSRAIRVQGSATTIYVADNSDSWYVADCSDPDYPYLLGRFSLGGIPESLELSGDRLVLTSASGDLQINAAQCDISPLGAPVLTGVQQAGQRLFFWITPDDPLYDESCLYRGTTSGFEPLEPVACTDAGYFIDTDEVHRWYVLRHRDSNGQFSPLSNEVEMDGAVPVPDAPTASNWSIMPNPFNPVTRIRCELPTAERLVLSVYDLHGRRVRDLSPGWCEAGTVEVLWDGMDDDARTLPSGSYFVRLEAGSWRDIRKVTLLK